MAGKSSIHRLPEEIKAYIEAQLATGCHTLDSLIADLRERFPAEANAGELPSRSAIGRYGQKLERRLAAIRPALKQPSSSGRTPATRSTRAARP